MKLDLRQHFWKYNPAHQVWMTEAMEVCGGIISWKTSRPCSSKSNSTAPLLCIHPLTCLTFLNKPLRLTPWFIPPQ